MPDRASSLVRAHVAPQTRGRCALCNQLLPDGQRSPVTEVEDLTNFVDQRYFQMLATTSFTDVNPRLPAAGGPEASPPRPGRSRTRSTGSQMNGDAEQLSSKSFNDGYYERFFIEVAKLGRGYRGSVFLCQHLLDGIALSEYAIKKIPVGESHTWLVRMLKEVRLLERLQHPNVVDFKHVWLEHHSPTIYGPPVPTLFVLMNLANGGNLEDFICVQHDPTGPTGGPLTAKEILRLRQQNQAAVNVHKITFSGEWQATGGSSAGSGARTKRFPNPAELRGGIGWAVNADGSFVVPSRKVRYLTQEQIWSFFLDITRGLAHLHRNRIVHRDLKPPNLLLQFADVSQKNVDPCPRVLISDFGECEILSEQEQTRRRSGATGTLEFTAPELLSGDGEGTVEEGIAADLWALGMILFFCCYSRLPWSQVDDVDLLKSEILAAGGGIRLPEPPDDADEGSARVSRELRGLMELLLDADGNRRPSAQSILDRFDAGSSSWHRAPRSPVEDNV
ncbi:kinase-like domain-containing protein [Hyaloraphidium curvatum]|nr:kinase-like domain-containing protein [Hyaloraphidium curvatum]